MNLRSTFWFIILCSTMINAMDSEEARKNRKKKKATHSMQQISEELSAMELASSYDNDDAKDIKEGNKDFSTLKAVFFDATKKYVSENGSIEDLTIMKSTYNEMKKIETYTKDTVKKELMGLADDLSDNETDSNSYDAETIYAPFKKKCTDMYAKENIKKALESQQKESGNTNAIRGSELSRLLVEQEMLNKQIQKLEEERIRSEQESRAIAQKIVSTGLAVQLLDKKRRQDKENLCKRIDIIKETIQQKENTLATFEASKVNPNVNLEKRASNLKQITDIQNELVDLKNKKIQLEACLTRIERRLATENSSLFGWMSW